MQSHAVAHEPLEGSPDGPKCDGAGQSDTSSDTTELRIRRLGIRVPPSALVEVLVGGLPEPRIAGGRFARPYKNPYSCRDELDI